MWEKSKGITKYDKKTIPRDIRTTQCGDKTIKCEKKNKKTTKCEKRTITYDVGTV